ncbi:flagellar hook-length control protein FliK [Parasphingorhabdus cellanae]|uniref:Flagellar hook-length control protein FliK n=1 Tax=Parasphingorhabdus cellanae TaxID=2806553 RepID=A0ABX7T7J9_9SPHN|nr:flagellar hook-length control protein FliK [Parasphingorhabdus cellanae]QTD56477.1 flagellar hook-length control protein FliK [Parasphingorhabdus cellanae]
MNSPFRLVESFDAKTMTAPLRQPFGLPGGDEFALRFVDASLAIEDNIFEVEQPGGEVSEEDKSDILSLDEALQPVPFGELDETMDVPLSNQDKGFPAAVLNDAKALGENSLSATAKAEEIRGNQNQIASLIKKEMFQIGRGHQALSADKPVTSSSATIGQNNKTTAPVPFADVGPADLKLFLDNRLNSSRGEKRDAKLTGQEDGAFPVARSVTQVVQAPSTIAAYPMINNIADTATVVRTHAVTAPTQPILDTGMDDQWIARLGDEIGKLTGEKATLNFQLKPHNLGRLHIEILSDAAGNSVRMDTDNEAAKLLILGAQGRLEQDIRLAGSKLVRVDVTHQEQSGSQPDQQGTESQGRDAGLDGRKSPSANGHIADTKLLATPDFGGTSSSVGARYA